MLNKSVTRKSPLPIKIPLLFLVGGIGYYLIEVLFRGHSHWSMAICGGICLVGIYCINLKFSNYPYALCALMCSLLITAVEFVAGCIVNLWLGWNVWSYNSLPFNFMGQISLLFSCIWFFLSFGVCILISFVQKRRNSFKLKKSHNITAK